MRGMLKCLSMLVLMACAVGCHHHQHPQFWPPRPTAPVFDVVPPTDDDEKECRDHNGKRINRPA